VIALALKVLPRTRWGLGAAVFAAAVVSVVAASAGFVLQFWLGGEEVGQSFGAMAAAILGTHVLVGVGEGVITAGAVTAVAVARPDLVYALRGTRLAQTVKESV
jgi:cobalt/nickel transport system permease protein